MNSKEVLIAQANCCMMMAHILKNAGYSLNIYKHYIFEGIECCCMAIKLENEDETITMEMAI